VDILLSVVAILDLCKLLAEETEDSESVMNAG